MSHGLYHDRVPRDLKGNLQFRRFLMEKTYREPQFRKAVVDACRDDFLFFVNALVWQFNPNAIGDASTKIGPFVSWKIQETVFDVTWKAMRERDDVVCDKSREMGASWWFLFIFLWRFLFHAGETFIVVSRNADLVDKADKPGSMFWKLDYVIRHLPEWVADASKDGPIRRKVMSLSNRATRSFINGESTTEKMAVGDRATAMLLDEFSQVPNAYEVYDRTSDTSGCRIFNGTHKGTNTCFNYLSQKAGTVPNLKKVTMHWTHHPDKAAGLYHWDPQAQRPAYHDPLFRYEPDFKPVSDGSPTGGYAPGVRSPWYDAQCSRKGSARGIAADLDINPTGSVEQLFDALMIANLKAQFCRDPLPCDLEYDRETAEPKRIHPHATGLLKVWHRLDADGKPPKARYAIGADSAQGNGNATASCASVVNAETGEKVSEYSNPSIEPKEFAYFLVALGRLYKDYDGRVAKLCWETGGPGGTVGKHVMLLKYPDMYFRTTEHRMKKEISDIPGWPNSPDSMMTLMISYRDALRNRQFLNRSTNALSETLHFVFKADGYIEHTGTKDPKDNSAAKQNHGDMTVADALAWKMVEEMKRLVRTTGVAAGAGEFGPADFLPPVVTLGGRQKLAKVQGTNDWA